MPDDYASNQSRKNREARAAHDEWIASLSPKELDQVKQLGLDKFDDDDCRVHSNRGDKDAADMHDAAHSPQESTEQAPPVTLGQADPEALWDALRRMIGELLSAPNARLTIECLALASGVAFLGDPEAEIGRRHGISRAAVSKRCVEITERLGLPPSRAMRSLTARRKYAAARRRVLRRNS